MKRLISLITILYIAVSLPQQKLTLNESVHIGLQNSKNLKISKIKKLKTSYANLPSDVKNRIDDYKMKKNVDKYNI